MICDICKKNEASIHVVKIVNGDEQQFNICEECIKKQEGSISSNGLSTFLKGLQEIIGTKNYMEHEEQEISEVCPNCGTSYKEFSETGFLGCSECYRKFYSNITYLMRKSNLKLNHIGKIPSSSLSEVMNKRTIKNLEKELQKAVSEENYERAIELRDAIKEIENSIRG